MAKVKLELGAQLDLLNKDELGAALHHHQSWERDAAFGKRQIDLPVIRGNVDGSGNLNLGGDQPDQNICGPTSGFYWGVRRLSVDGMAANESVKIYKNSRFVATITQATGWASFGKGVFTLKPGDFIRVTGASMTMGEQITVTGEATTVPGPLQWKLTE